MLGLTGQIFWQHESYDRLVRTAEEFRKVARYIEMNPVNAGLVASPCEFPWSSAGADYQSAAGSNDIVSYLINSMKTGYRSLRPGVLAGACAFGRCRWPAALPANGAHQAISPRVRTVPLALPEGFSVGSGAGCSTR
jgi:hypothetical protein